MPQTFLAVQCAFCRAFQATLDKKNKKYACAICGQKQSFRDVHAISNSGKDIRKVVQELNELRGAYEQTQGQAEPTQHLAGQQVCSRDQQQSLQWDVFAETAVEQNNEADEDTGPYITAIPDTAVRGKGRQLEKPRSKRQKLQGQDGEGQLPSSSNGLARPLGLGVDNLQRGSSKAAPFVSKRTMQQQQQLAQHSCAQGLVQMPAGEERARHSPVPHQQISEQQQQHCGDKAWHQQQQPGTVTSSRHNPYPQWKPVNHTHHHHHHQQQQQQQQQHAAGAYATDSLHQQPQMPLRQQQADNLQTLESWVPREQVQQQQHQQHQQQQQRRGAWGQKQQQQSQQQVQQQQPRVQAIGMPPKPPAQASGKADLPLLDKQHLRSAGASSKACAWGEFVDQDTPVCSSDDDADGAVDEQGFYSGKHSDFTGFAVDNMTSRAISKWA